MKAEQFEFLGHNKTVLSGYLWLPEGEIRCILQIAHGMTEHMGRYHEFAEYLCSLGIAVAGFDLRGHGQNSGDHEIASFGGGGWASSIEDMRLFFELMRRRFSGAKYYMLGFSLGSFLLREYLSKYHEDGELSGAIIMGTGHQPGWLLSILMAVVKGEIRKAGFDQTTDLVRQLSFGTYNQKFKPNRTAADWLCADEAELDKYLEDSLIRKDISAGLFHDLLGSMKQCATLAHYDGWNRGLPILLISGEDDPVGDEGKGVKAIYSRMVKSGMERVSVKMYPAARHDLLHEKKSSAAQAWEFIADWITSNP